MNQDVLRSRTEMDFGEVDQVLVDAALPCHRRA